MGRLFGTDGVRGLAGSQLTAELARQLGAAAVVVLGRHQPGRPRLVVGRDPRSSGEWLEDALVAGVRSAGGDVILAGVEPTPAIAFHTVDAQASAGVVISASHNPPEYNGIKFFAADGTKLSDDLEDEIETILGTADGDSTELAVGGEILPSGDARERYFLHLVSGASARLDGMRIVVDCANGAASELAPELLRRLGATVHAINDHPDGENINDGCGALFPDVVAAEVVRLGADAGICHDGDADRALFADAAGGIIDGDQVLAACAAAMHRAGDLPGDMVVTTVMANVGFHHAMREAGINVVSARVGDRYVWEDMLRLGAALGGEQSGHIIFRDMATTGDGLLTAIRFLSLAAAQGRSVADLASIMRRYPQRMVNVAVRDRDALEGSAAIRDAVGEAESALGHEGRVLVRPSGTEPLVRVMVEAPSEEIAVEHAARLAAVVASELGDPAAAFP